MQTAFPTVGVLYAVHKLLSLVAQDRYTSRKNFFLAGGTINEIPKDDLLSLCDLLNWVTVPEGQQDDTPIVATKRGIEIAHASAPNSVRMQLEDCILLLQPAWRSVLTRGIHECQNSLPTPIKQAFKEAELFDPSIPEVLHWWDNLYLHLIPTLDAANLSTGREAEKLTLEYEAKRTGKTPFWMAIESNAAGYDVLSTISATDGKRLRIEVKGTQSGLSFGSIYITANEWRVAQSHGAHLFHIWLLHQDRDPELIVYSIEDIARHIPTNKGNGTWETTVIPLRGI